MQVIEGLSVTERFYVEFFEMGQMTIQKSILKTERKADIGHRQRCPFGIRCCGSQTTTSYAGG